MSGRIIFHRISLVARRINSPSYCKNYSLIPKKSKAFQLWRLVANHPTRFRLGTFLTGTLGFSRGFSLWGSKPKPEESAAPPQPVAASPEVVAADEADRLYDADQVTQLYDHLIKFKDTNNDDLLWRLARAARCVAQLSTTKPEDKKRLTYESLDFAKRALKSNPENFACHKWYAISLSEVGDYEGTKQKISNAFVIKQHFEKAISLNPQDATSVHLLGLWCYTFADMPWYQKKIAAVVFTTPPSSSYEEALAQFLKAERVSPNFYSKNLLMIGKTYKCLGDNKMALLYLTKARDYPPKTEEDSQVHQEAHALIQSLTKK